MDTQTTARIGALKPTQGAIGFEHMREKIAVTRAVPREQLPAFLHEHALRVVRGPDHALFVVDHHHWARAWRELGIDEAPVRIARDFSALDRIAFVSALREHGWLHAVDAQGNEASFDALPASIAAIPDDPYLSLAAFVRMAGIYDDPPEFNAKFAWADYFRTRIKGDFATIAGFAKALAQAIAASREDDARDLPGFRKQAA